MLRNGLKLLNSTFARNVAAVATGTAASQAILMISSPLVTRLYGPSAYGIQGVFFAITAVGASVAALTYPMALVLPKNDADAIALGHLSVMFGLGLSLFAALILYSFGAEILSLLNAGEIAPFMYLIPLSMFISVLSAVMEQWLIRRKAFILSAKVAATQTFLMSCCKVILGYINPTSATLVLTGTLAGLFGPVLMFLGLSKNSLPWKNHLSNLGCMSTKDRIWVIAKQHRDFPLFRTPQVLLNTISQSLPVLLLAGYFGAAAAGYYAIALSVLGIPVGLIGGSVLQVFYPRFNEAFTNKQDVRALLAKTTLGMAALGVVPFSIIGLFGPFLFELAFGNGWCMAGEYAQWLAIWWFCAFINRPAVSAIPVIRMQGMFLIYEIASVVLRVLALYVGFAILKNEIASIALFSIVGGILNCALIYFVVMNSRDMSSQN